MNFLISCVTMSSAFAVDPDQAMIDKGRTIYSRLTGKKPKISDPKFIQMVGLLKAGKNIEAAAIATDDAGFVNNTLRLFAAPIHNASQSYRQTELSESMAFIMGKIRDRADYREILTGKDYYVPDLTGITCNDNEDNYRCADRQGLDLSSKLMHATAPARPIFKATVQKIDGKDVRDTYPTELPNGDVDRSGIFTQDGFAYAGYRAGTNRRVLQQFFNTMYCVPNNAMRASALVQDRWVGPDVSRDPEGTGLATYKAECRTCHGATFDGLRGAFAYLDGAMAGESNTNGRTITIYDPSKVNAKYSRNSSNYPNGYRTIDNSWELMWTEAQRAQFGWDGGGSLSGVGVHSLAVTLSHFDQLPRCMVQKVAELVCPVDPNATQSGSNQLLSDQLKTELVAQLKKTGDVRKIFEQIAVRPECLGK